MASKFISQCFDNRLYFALEGLSNGNNGATSLDVISNVGTMPIIGAAADFANDDDDDDGLSTGEFRSSQPAKHVANENTYPKS